MPESSVSQPEEPTSTAVADKGGYAPYGQLVKMLMPSAGSIALYDPAGELVWCSDGYERPELRKLLDDLRASDTVAGRGRVENTVDGVPAFVAGLRSSDGAPLGAVVIELNRNNNQSGRYSGSLLAGLLRPVLDCLENRMNLERTVLAPAPSDNGGLDLLLSVDENEREDASALEQLMRHCVQHLGCALGALLVPDKGVSISCTLDPALGGSQLLDRTQRHLLAWVQLNNRPMVVNRVAGSPEAAPYKILSCPIRDPNNRVTGLVALFRSTDSEDFELRDVRILEFVSRKAVGILNSQHDPLTGLVNRLIFERRAQRHLDVAAVAHALLYIDIDRLQAINEAFGFHAGDEVIQRIAEVVRRSTGPEALVSRIGGDRFAVLLPKRTLAEGLDVGRKILAAAGQIGYVDGTESLPVSVSVGVAAAQRERLAHLIASAELACKRAKQQGRNQIESESLEGNLTLLRSRQLVAATSLQNALKNNDFRLEAQPIVGLRTRPSETIGYELLVRMRSPEGELLAPDKFLDAADRYQFLPALDRWVICSAIETLRTHGIGDGTLCFTVNVSAQSLASGTYAAFALEQISQAGLPAEAFCFEIKEAAAMNQLAGAEQLIGELSRAGCKLALDHFGWGLSSLAHLKRLPVDYLKIDGRFVRRVLDDRVAESIVSGIAKAARTLGVAAIAEHVESVEIAERLLALEVEYGQGFHLGRPQAFGKAAAAPAARSSAM